MFNPLTKAVATCVLGIKNLLPVGVLREYITTDACKRAVHALIISCLDYCNSLLADAPLALIKKLQSIQNRAARLVLLVAHRSFGSATPLLHQLSWLPIKLRIAFNICVLVFKCLNSSAPVYLCDLVPPAESREETTTTTGKQPTETYIQQEDRKVILPSRCTVHLE